MNKKLYIGFVTKQFVVTETNLSEKVCMWLEDGASGDVEDVVV